MNEPYWTEERLAEHRKTWPEDKQPFPMPSGYGWIQWKGTNVCMDVFCSCGKQYHVDDEFVYFVKCPICGQVSQVGAYVKLYPCEIPPGDDQITMLIDDSWPEV